MMISNADESHYNNSNFWLSEGVVDGTIEIDCLCLGTGRFLRSVLVPPLVAAGYKPALIQTRGRSFIEFMSDKSINNGEGATYPVDTVAYSGKIETTNVDCCGAFSLGKPNDKAALMNFVRTKMKKLSILGIGVTEAGLASPHTKVMQDLYEMLKTFCQLIHDGIWENSSDERIFVINMDNVPSNGNTIRNHMMALASSDVEKDNDAILINFLSNKVRFLNTMVDRITSKRDGSCGMIPRCEPTPAKALVISDDLGELPSRFHSLKQNFGVVVRSQNPVLIQGDISLKLRIANATHTAIAHAMALTKIMNTEQLAVGEKEDAINTDNDIDIENATAPDSCISTTNKSEEDAKLLMSYLDSFYKHQIFESEFPGISSLNRSEIQDVYDDWRRRLTHAHFGLSTFFPTLNGAAKGGIRLGPTISSLIQLNKPITVTTVYAYAALLRWLTPIAPISSKTQGGNKNVYTGWLQGTNRKLKGADNIIIGDDNVVEYIDGLRYNLELGWYEFRCDCKVQYQGVQQPLSNALANIAYKPRQPEMYLDVIRSYLIAPSGGNLGNIISTFETFVRAIATLYSRMIAGDSLLDLLQEMADFSGPYTDGMSSFCNVLVDDRPPNASLCHPLHYRKSPIPATSGLLKASVDADSINSVVASEVASAITIDLHTHLLPPSHGALCSWGIDELLTYHYLVSEYFMTACTSITPESFYILNKKEQAEIIWKALFIDRSPISEACRGVITALVSLGLSKEVSNRDLNSIRKYYDRYRDGGFAGAEEFSELVFEKSGVEYAVMTNIPFDSNQSQYWRPKRKEYSYRYRSALRVDPLLSGDRNTIEKALHMSGYAITLEGARQYLRDWCDTMKPEYMMASTPHDFVWGENTGSLGAGVTRSSLAIPRRGVNEDAMKEPFAFVDIISGPGGIDCSIDCNGDEDGIPSVIDENSDFVSEVLMKVCEERDLPVALKIGAHRGVNPMLKQAGDGLATFVDAGLLGRLCSRFPKVLFLATFLSRNSQHEACVLASKFRNLHIYGCWWFCNNPSIIREITQMRIEMLGTAFTAQHSDSRVLDQLLYKWPHSRAVVARVLQKEYEKLCASGWNPTREEIRRDVARLFGGSYEEFMAKSLQAV